MLLIRPKPSQHESLQQYAFRLAGLNMYSYKDILKLVQLSGGISFRTISSDDRSKLRLLFIKLTGHPEVKDLIDPYEFKLKYKGIFDLSSVKLCPFCMTEDKHGDYRWHYRYKSICSIHRVFLTDRCIFCLEMYDASILISKHCLFCKASLEDYDFHMSYKMEFNIEDFLLFEDTIEVVSRKIKELGPFLIL